MEGDQGGGAGRVDGDRRALQAQGVRDAPGDDARRAGGAEVAVGAFVGGALDDGGVVLAVGPGEDGGAAGAQSGRVEPGALQGLPGGLQEEALLRVHRQRLARRDGEELGVEIRGRVEESADRDVRGAGAVRVGVVEGVEVPAPVVGERADGIHSVGQQPPQPGGARHAAGEAAADADDGDRLVGGRAGTGRHGGRCPGLRRGEFGVEEADQVGGGGVVEGEGGGQGQAGGAGQRGAQLDGGQRVEAQVTEGPPGVDQVAGAVAQHLGGEAAYQVEQEGPAVGPGEGGQFGAEAGGGAGHGGGVAGPGGRGPGGGLAGGRNAVEEGGGPGGREGGEEAVPVDVGHGDAGVVRAQGLPEGLHGAGGRQRPQPSAAQPFGGVAGRHARLVPGPPGDRGGGEALGAAEFGERVEVAVGRGVGAEAAAAPDTGDGGEEDEGVQGPVGEEIVEVAGALHLGAARRGEPVGVQLRQRGGGRGSGRVEDGVHGVFAQEGGEGVPVGHVAGDDQGRGAQGGEFRVECGRTGRLGAASAGQDQAFGAVPGGPAGDPRAEGAGAAGDQDGTAQLRFTGSGGGGGGDEPPGQETGGAQRHLVLGPVGEEGAQPLPVHGGGVRRQVDAAAPALGVLQRGHPAQPPDLGEFGAGREVVGGGGDRAAGQAPEPGAGRGVPLVREDVEQAEGGGGVGEEGEQAVDRLPVLLRAPRPFLRLGEGQRPRPAGGERGGRRTGAVHLAVPGARGDEQPVPGQGRCPPVLGGGPGDAVPPPVQQGLLAASAPPGGEGGQHLVQPYAGQVEGAGQRLGVLPLDALPEQPLPLVGRAGGTGRAVEPVTAVPEGVGGQGDGPGGRGRAAGGEEGGPVDASAVGVEPGERLGQGGGLRTVLAQRRDEERVVRLRQRVARHGGQYALGAQFQEAGDALGVQAPHPVGEPDRLADVPHPVAGRGEFGTGGLAGEVRDHRDERTAVRQRLGDLAELRQHRVHQGGVEGMADRQLLYTGTLAGQRGGDLLDRLRRTGDHDGARPVHRGDRDTVHQGGADLVLAGLDRDHGSALGQGVHEPATGRHQRAGVVETQDARDVGGGDLADRVAEERVRADAPRLHQAEQRHFDGEQGRLREPRTVQQPVLPVEDDRLQRPAQLRVQARGHRVEGVREDRVRGVQLTPHRDALRALAREQQREAAARHGAARSAGGLLQAGEQLLPCRAGHDGPVFQSGAGRGQGVADGARGEAGAGGDVVPEPGELGVEGFGGAGRDGPGERRGLALAPGGRSGGGFLGEGRRLLHDDVGVGAADAEGGDTGPAGARLVPGPGAFLAQEFHGARGPVDVRGGGVGVQGAGELVVAHRLDHLDDPGDTGGGLGVADVGLHRPEPQGAFGVPVLPVRGEEGLRLDGVAQLRPGAVRLHRVHVGRGEPGGVQRLADDALLRGSVGGGQAVGGAVLVDGRAAQHGEDLVAVAAGVGDLLQQEQAHAFAPAGAVRPRAEGLAAAVGGEPPLPAELHEGVRGGHDGDAAGHGEVAFAAVQRADGPVQGDEGGGAGGVDGDRRALQAEGVRDAPGDDAARAAVGDEPLQPVGDAVEAGGVVVVHDARVDAGAAALEAPGVEPGAFEEFPGGLQDEPLLRVHRQGLARRDAEEFGVEPGGLVEEPALAGVRGAGALPAGVVQVLGPAPVGGEGGDGVPAGGDQLPQLLGGGDAAGVAAGHGDDGDGLAVALLQLAQGAVGLAEVAGHLLEVVTKLGLVGDVGHGCHLPQAVRGSGTGRGAGAWRAISRRTPCRSGRRVLRP